MSAGPVFTSGRTAVSGSEKFAHGELNRPIGRKEPLAIEPATLSETDVDQPRMKPTSAG